MICKCVLFHEPSTNDNYIWSFNQLPNIIANNAMVDEKVLTIRLMGVNIIAILRYKLFFNKCLDSDQPGHPPRPKFMPLARPKFAQNQPRFYKTFFLKCTSLY